MSTHLHLVTDTTPDLPLVATGALIHAPDGFAVEVVPDGDRVVAQAEHFIKWLRANNAAMSRLWSAVLADEHRPAAVAVLAAWLLDAQRLELTPEQAATLADQLGDEAHKATTFDPALVLEGRTR